MSRYTLRTACPADVARIQALDAAAYGAEAYGHTTLSQYLDLFPDLLFVAEIDGAVAGYALGAVATGGTRGMMLALIVAPEHRGLGLGEALARRLVDALAAQPIHEIFLTVHPANTTAQKLYARLGFAIAATRPDYYGPGTTALEMRRVLEDR